MMNINEVQKRIKQRPPFQMIEKIVDEIGRYLHQTSEEQTANPQQGPKSHLMPQCLRQEGRAPEPLSVHDLAS